MYEVYSFFINRNLYCTIYSKRKEVYEVMLIIIIKRWKKNGKRTTKEKDFLHQKCGEEKGLHW